MSVHDNLTVNGNLNVAGDITYGSTIQSPYWIAEKINMANRDVVTSSGQVGFTLSRASGYSTGIVRVLFDSPHPSGGSCRFYTSPSPPD